MTQLPLTSAAKNRFPTDERRRQAYVRDTPGLAKKVDALTERLIKVVRKGVLIERNFWLRILYGKGLDDHTLRVVIRKIQALNKELGISDDGFESIITNQKRRHLQILAIKEIRTLRKSKEWKPEKLYNLLRRGKMTLSDVGSSKEEMRGIARQCEYYSNVKWMKLQIGRLRSNAQRTLRASPDLIERIERCCQKLRISLRKIGTSERELRNFTNALSLPVT